MKWNALLAEFIGVFGLCLIGIIAIHNLGSQDGGLIGIALAHGLIITVLVAAYAAVSGAHFNPAVSFGMLLAKKISGAEFFAYVISQIAGGVVGSVVAMTALGKEAVIAGTPALGAATTGTTGLIVEIIGTFFLVGVIFAVAVDKRSPGNAPMFIGLTIVACILAFGPLSGCAINPARYLGPALVGGMSPNAWVWLVGPILGGAIASLAYTLVFAEKSTESTS
ncbi:aquaporin [Kamptonema cortianum]|nr:aquaporin [Geitlerinema splendidum]MDK3155958.1 aquaporin [Kamptonema cortianum]